MNIMVLDVPTTFGGGLTILLQYYQKAIDDKENKWFFVVGKPYAELKETDNVTVMYYPKAKSNWIARSWFDIIVAPQIAKKYKIHRLISLQGSALNGVSCEQYLYMQQSLLFNEFPTSLRYEPRIWIYKNILSRIRKHDVMKADKLIVQIESSKKSCAKKYSIPESKIIIESPICNLKVNEKYKRKEQTIFFYPPGPFLFKNVDVIIDASEKLKEKGIDNYLIILLLTGKENSISKKWKKKCEEKNLRIEFHGYVKHEEMGKYYSQSVLLFPSYTESFGLPLLEAMEYSCPILAADVGYAHDVLGEYSNAHFFNPKNCMELAELMMHFI